MASDRERGNRGIWNADEAQPLGNHAPAIGRM